MGVNVLILYMCIVFATVIHIMMIWSFILKDPHVNSINGLWGQNKMYTMVYVNEHMASKHMFPDEDHKI
jgi:hypothetical protein